MSDSLAQQELKSITIEAVVIRADGTVEDLGVVSEWHKEDEEPKGLLAKLKRKKSN